MSATGQGTFSQEDALPRVPLPSLSDSCDRFLEWCTPLLDAAELSRTEAAVAEFRAPDSPAHVAQQALEEYADAEGVHSWLDDFWRSRYLGRRDRIALNANFFFLFRELPGLGEGSSQVEVGAATIATAVAYQRALADETVPTSTQRGAPLSMEGNRHLFSTTRIPGTHIDTVRTPYSTHWPAASRERHVIVLCRGTMFRLDVIGSDGVPHTLAELQTALEEIRTKAPERGPAVGHLTTLARADWAGARRHLLTAGNAAVLDVVERALFCLCLEDAAPESQDEACAGLLAGDSGNRWFDKAVSFVVFANGMVGVNGEHCCLDGTNVIELIDAMYAEPAAAQSAASGAREQGTPTWQPLAFALDEDLADQIERAGRDFAAYAEGNAMMLRSYDVGSDLPKKLGVSPDAFIQLAIQLAHRRAKGFTGATYESVATRRYHHGRTEAMRVITPEVIAFVEAMVDNTVSKADRRSAFQAAAGAHVARAKACQAGEAPEQHLWELQLLAARRELDLPTGLYESPGWVKLRDDFLSTSAVPSSNIVAFGFGATSDHCIGVAYLLLPGEFGVYLATPRSVGEQMVAFSDALADALTELQELLT